MHTALSKLLLIKLIKIQLIKIFKNINLNNRKFSQKNFNLF